MSEATLMVQTDAGMFPLSAADVDQLRAILGGPQRVMYTLQEVADACHVSINTARKWRRTGVMRVVRLGDGAVRVPAAELDRLVSGRRKAGAR